jgi:aminopeptidase N
MRPRILAIRLTGSQTMKRCFCFALALICLSLTIAFSRDTYPRATAIDAIHYSIHLDIKDAGDDINAETEIIFGFLDDSVKSIALDFAGFAADSVTENNRAAQFAQSGDRLNIQLQRAYARGDRCAIVVKYHGKPGDGLFFKKNKFGDRAIFADNWPNRAHNWFPSIDHPCDKATVEFFVTAPARYDVIANGSLIETTNKQNGAKLTHWSEKTPIPTYCMVIGATEFSVINIGSWNSIQLSYYLYPKDRERGIKDFGRALQMIEMYSNLIAPYPYEKLALVQSSTRFGGMENSSNIFFDQDAIDGSGKLESTVAHEIAHQWFGDSVTEADWHHLWLSEGFATYFGALFFERADGRDKFVKMMLANKESYLKEYAKDPRPIYDTSIANLFDLLNANNYQKGAWVLHMLRHIMGDEKFFAGIRDYYNEHRDGNALTVDFQRAMERRAGRPLDWFFRQWINEPGYPIYDAVWRWDESAKELRLRIAQKQEKTIFAMPLDLEINSGDQAQRETIEMREREQLFNFKLDGKPQSVAIDPDEWALKVLSLREEK